MKEIFEQFSLWMIFGTACLVSFVCITTAFFILKHFHTWCVMKFIKFKNWFYHNWNIIFLNLRLYKIIKLTFYNHSPEVIFTIFLNFYEKFYSHFENCELPQEDFPIGKANITNIYKWILKDRQDNYSELNKLEFNDVEQSFLYWGSNYRSLKFKIKDGQLIIYPLTEIFSENVKLDFQKQILKITTALYDLDTEYVNWIISRRKYFNL